MASSEREYYCEDYEDGHKLVLDFFSAESESECKKNIYKFTDCGAWISFHDYGVVVGSIVEGSDCGTNNYTLKYKDKFSAEDIQRVISTVEDEAEIIWKWANEMDQDGKTDAEKGYDWPLL